MDHPLIPTLFENPILPYDYTDWGGNHIWLHKQPLALWSIALSLKVFGISEFAVRIPSIILTTIGIIITYRIAKLLFDWKVGFWSAFLYAIHGNIIENSAGRAATDHIDVFFLFFIQVAVLLALEFSIRKKSWINILCGIAIGLAIISKWLPALIVLPIWFLLLRKNAFTWKQVVLHGFTLVSTIALVCLPWQLYIFNEFPLEAQYENNYNRAHILTAVEGREGDFFFHFTNMRIFFGELIYIPVIWLTWKCIRKRRKHHIAIWVWILIPFLFFSFVATKMHAYTLFTAPAIFILTGLFIRYLKLIQSRLPRKWFASVVIIMLVALPIRYSMERIKLDRINHRETSWAKDFKTFSRTIPNQKNAILFNYEHNIEAMFYSDITAYSGLRDSTIIDSLLNVGYDVYINDPMDGSSHDQRVHIVSITDSD